MATSFCKQACLNKVYKKQRNKVESMISIFEFFVTTKWYMENKKIYEILKSLSQ